MFPVITVPVTATDRAACAATDILQRIGEKWSLLVLALLAERRYGFNELDRAVPDLSRRMLVRTLQSLIRDGLVRRGEPRSVAGRVEYDLTDLGRSLLPLVQAVGEWAERHDHDIRAARHRYDTGLDNNIGDSLGDSSVNNNAFEGVSR
jgi:DNA-binding HxlR family transcriptional regulator